MNLKSGDNNIELENKVFLFLVSIFIAMLTISNVLAFKLIEVTPLLVAPAAVIAYSLTFFLTDVMVEIFGKEKSKFVVYTGFVTQILVIVVVQIAIMLPAAGFFEYQEEFALVLSQSRRIIIASLIAYFVSQMWDIYLFTYIKKKTGEKLLWLRNNGSTFTSQIIDTVLFISIAFAGTRSPGQIMGLILGQYLLKLIIAVLDTPFVYVLVYFIKNKLAVEPIGD
ncbi:MAG: queuosine precursor transporter [Halanaerobiales bacterium]